MALGAITYTVDCNAAYFEPLDTILPSPGAEYASMEIQNNYISLYKAYQGTKSIEFIDFSDPQRLVSAGNFSFEHAVYNPDWKGAFFYIPGGHAVEGAPNAVYIYNTSDFQNIVLASQITLTYHYVSSAEIKESYALIGCDYNGSEGGLYVLSVADPYNPYVVWGCDSIGACDLILGQTLAYGYTWCNDIKILDISLLDSPLQVSRFSCPLVNAIDVDETRHLLYATCFDYGLLIYDISNPSLPTLLSTTPMPDPGAFAVDVCHSKLNRQFLFISAYYSPVLAFDTTDPLNPVAVARYNMLSGYSTYISCQGELVFADNHYGMACLRFHSEGSEIEDEPDVPNNISLSQNYPNPFNQGTTISYSLPAPGNIKLEIYDALGRKVSTLFDGFQAAGDMAINWDASNFTSGTYFYKLTAPDLDLSRKMTVLK